MPCVAFDCLTSEGENQTIALSLSGIVLNNRRSLLYA